MSTDLVSDEIRATFEADGVVKIPALLDADWIDTVLADADDQLVNPGPWVSDTNPGAVEGRLFTTRYRWESSPVIGRFIRETPVAQIAADLMSSSTARFYFDHLLVKEPHTTDPTPWHQDVPYWPFLGKQICSAWVSLTETTVAESSLEFVRGSHRWDAYYAPEAFGGGSGWTADFDGEPCPDIEADRDSYDIVGFDVEPGDALFFSAWILHGAPGNDGDHRRAALSTRWLGDDATWFPHAGCDPTVTQDNTTSVPGEPLNDEQRFPLLHSSA